MGIEFSQAHHHHHRQAEVAIMEMKLHYQGGFMLVPRFVVRMFSVALMVLGTGIVFGQTYAQKPIRIVASAAGSGNDFIARLIAQGISGRSGQQVIVDNRAGQLIPGEIVAKSPADGQTLLLASSALWLAPFLQTIAPFDPVRDFLPITLTATSPNILVVHPSLPVKSVKELIALGRARPGELNSGLGPAGGSIHLAAELFRTMTGVDIVGVRYKGTAQALNALISGEVQMMFPNAAAVTPHVNSGRLKALAVTTAHPSALAPNLPTMAASGLPGYESVAIWGTFAPAKTPKAIIDRLNHEIVQVLNRADVKEKLFNVGAEVLVSSPEEFATTVKSEMAKWGKVIKDAGIRVE